MGRPPRTIEYICLSCGTQGSIHTEADDGDLDKSGGIPLRCPRCKGTVLYLEREAALSFQEAVTADKTIGQ